MTIYVDVVFMENVFMNYIILFATSIINKQKVKIINLLFSSMFGGLYAVLSFVPFLQNLSGILFKILLSVAMVYIAFKPQNFSILAKDLLFFYLASFTFGGVAFALLYIIKPNDILMKNGIYIGTYPLKIALIGGILGFIIITMAFEIIKRKLVKKNMFYNIEILINDKTKKISALLDTGNFLKEPITGMPVVIVEKRQMEKILPVEILENINTIIEGNLDKITNIQEYVERFRVIPFSSIGNKSGLLLGIKPDLIKVEHEDGDIISKKNVILGLYEDRLSKNGKYQALIGLDLVG